jgi:predicted transcriptional regulator
MSAKDQITVRLSADERLRLEELADEAGETVSEVCRRAVIELYEREVGRGK